MKNLMKVLPVMGLFFTVACTKTTVTPTAPAASLLEMNAKTVPAFSIGIEYGGGIIFFIDSTGEHGLIAAPKDMDTIVSWYNQVYWFARARGTGIGKGATNTQKIISALGDSGVYAAKICADYSGGGYTDWFLPSKGELNLLYKRKEIVGGFISGYYWSSTEADYKYAWSQYFGFGYQGLNDKKFAFFVRAVRAF